MCGIVGVVGNERATSILVQGLEKLEYRGYDSAGIFVSNQQADYLVKAKGRIANLVEKIPADIAGNVGIGHTRWATHGKPTEQNAHPHQSPDERLVLVHNGVIENYLELKEQFLADATLSGETDTEIIVGVIRVLQEQTGDLQAAFQEALKLIHGSYALALVDRENPDTLYVAKNKSPLLIGLGDGFQVVCSDAMAMIQETNRFVEIMDGELVIVRAEGITILNPAGEQVEREAYVAELDVADLGKGTYPYYMLKEIDEQPAAMRKLAQTYTTEENGVTIDPAILTELKESDRIYIVACGTSAHAGWVGKNLLESLTGVPVEIHLSSEFGYHMPLLSAKPFFIFLSQSGETADSRQVLVEINRLGYPSLTVTNVPGSTLSREARFTLLLHAGPEIAVASTKAYTAQIALLALLAKAVGDVKGNEVAQSFDLGHELALVATAMDTIVDEKEQLAHYAMEYFHEVRNAFYIGRGVDYYLSMEAALKLKEISYIQAEGFAAGELKHGTIALIEEGTPVIAFINDEKTAAHTRGNLQEVEARGAHTLVIAADGLAKEADQIVLPAVHPLLRPLVSIVPAQLLAYYATIDRGLDVDKPRNLAKSVTVE